jgi:phosphoglycerate kinase
LKTYSKIQDIELEGKRVFVRVDFNVPLEKRDGVFFVTDKARIEGALPTIKYILERGGRCVLASHLGRPKGKKNPEYSLEPVAACLSELLDKEVVLADDCIGDAARGLSKRLRNSEVLMLENLRFHSGEEENAQDFVVKLLELCEVYISDAFGTLHRAHASTAGLPRSISEKGFGLLVQKELQYLEPLKENPARPFALIMGGSKVSDKIGVLENFMPKVDRILIGGAMAYAFLKARGIPVGSSYCPEDQVPLAQRILSFAESRNIQVVLPVDHIIAKDLKATSENSQLTEGEEIPSGWMAVDVGPRTLSLFGLALEGAKTVFWNGPVGVFENPAFSKGTFGLAKLISKCSALKLAGGGDVSAAIAASGCTDSFDFISTGGGATLEFLEGKELPGLKVLEVFRGAKHVS